MPGAPKASQRRNMEPTVHGRGVIRVNITHGGCFPGDQGGSSASRDQRFLGSEKMFGSTKGQGMSRIWRARIQRRARLRVGSQGSLRRLVPHVEPNNWGMGHNDNQDSDWARPPWKVELAT